LYLRKKIKAPIARIRKLTVSDSERISVSSSTTEDVTPSDNTRSNPKNLNFGEKKYIPIAKKTHAIELRATWRIVIAPKYCTCENIKVIKGIRTGSLSEKIKYEGVSAKS
jgi:hypothetical protein